MRHLDKHYIQSEPGSHDNRPRATYGTNGLTTGPRHSVVYASYTRQPSGAGTVGLAVPRAARSSSEQPYRRWLHAHLSERVKRNASERHQGGPRRGAGQRIEVEKRENGRKGGRLAGREARAKAGARRSRTMSKESPPSRSPSLRTVASVARRQLPAERGRRGVVEDEVESRSRGRRHSWPTIGTGGVGFLHTASTHAREGEWQSWRGQARRPDEAMPCAGSIGRARAQFKDAGRVLTSSWQRAPLASPPRGRSSLQRPPRTRRREEASPAMVPPEKHM